MQSVSTPSTMAHAAKRWVFTLNKYKEGDLKKIKAFLTPRQLRLRRGGQRGGEKEKDPPPARFRAPQKKTTNERATKTAEHQGPFRPRPGHGRAKPGVLHERGSAAGSGPTGQKTDDSEEQDHKALHVRRPRRLGLLPAGHGHILANV